MPVSQQLDAVLTARSLCFLSATAGFCGGLVAGVLRVAYGLFKNEGLAESAQTMLGAVVGLPIVFAMLALLGYPLYRLLCRSATYRSLTIISSTTKT